MQGDYHRFILEVKNSVFLVCAFLSDGDDNLRTSLFPGSESALWHTEVAQGILSKQRKGL